MAEMSKRTISIHEFRSRNPTNARSCRVRVSIDESPRGGSRVITDPFALDEGDSRHAYLAWYLEDGLSDDRFNHDRAAACTGYMHEYRIGLFNALGISDEVSGFGRSRIEINIFAYPESEAQKTDPSVHMSILDFYWELLELIPPSSNSTDHGSFGTRKDRKLRRLESTRVWPSQILSVSIRRVVAKKRFYNSNLTLKDVPKTVPWSTVARCPAVAECRVLLVIARKLARPGEYEISPSFIECALLRLFERRNREIGREFYVLEVVRPGSFKELEIHLNKTRPSSFQIVHFDMHGTVLCQKESCKLPRSNWRLDDRGEKFCRNEGDGHKGQASLIFAKLDKDGPLITSPHPAIEVAQLLYKNGVCCVALNACESARANDGDDANLSYVFLEQGICNVVAMSFRISDYMFVQYYDKFYKALFKRHYNVTEAATYARLKLWKYRERKDACDDPVEIYDWFVPVAYCNENILKMPVPIAGEMPVIQAVADKGSERVVRARRIVQAIKIFGAIAILSYWITVLFFWGNGYRMVLTCVLVLSAVTSFLLYLLEVSRAILCLRYVRNPAAAEIQCDVLDNNMLSIESELKRRKPIVLHGLSNIPDTLSLIDNLAFVWDRTKFIDLVITIPAAWFYQPEPVQMIRRWCCRIAHHAHCCQGEKSGASHHHPPERTMVIITDLELIFPQQPDTQLKWLQLQLLSRAQERLVRFFDQYFKDDKESQAAEALVVSAGDEKPYLFLSGSSSLEDPETLKASLDRLKVVGIRSTIFTEVGEYRSRTALIGEHISRG